MGHTILSLTQTPGDFAENCFGSSLSLFPHARKALLLFSATPHRAPTAAPRDLRWGQRENREASDLRGASAAACADMAIPLCASEPLHWKIRELGLRLSLPHAPSLLTPPWGQLEAYRISPCSSPALPESVMEFR